MAFKRQKISVVIPAFEEEKTIVSLIKECQEYSDNIIVAVAKKSEDKTFNLAKRAGVKVFRDKGEGKGLALLEGVKKAKNGIIVFIDADGSHVPRDIPKLVVPILKGKADLVIASRMKGGSDELSGTVSRVIRYLGSAIIILVINHRWNVSLTDCTNGFRAVKRNVVLDLDLKSKSFDIEQEMVTKALKKGYEIAEIASHEYERKYGESNINILKIGWVFVWRLLNDLF